MEEIERSFSSLKSDDKETLDEHKQLYKSRPNPKLSQEERRKSLLALQKEKRQKLLNENRELEEISHLKRKISDVWKQEIDFIEQRKSEREDWFKQTHRYKNTLMLSEWFLEIPDNFPEWIMVPCPKGQRTLLVSRLNCATAYNKYGSPITTFKSQLPRNTILDCIFCNKTSTFYVLDVLQWNSHCLRNCQTDFRFYWLKSKFSEYPQLGLHMGSNECAIKTIEWSKCDKCLLTEIMSRHPMFENNEPELDGLLFYHPEVFYSAGSTPLVGWLKPFMMPQVLSVPVSDQHLQGKPLGCASVNDYIELFNQKSTKKAPQKRRGRNKLMKFDDEQKENDSDLSSAMNSTCESIDDNSISDVHIPEPSMDT
ncbi:snurportin-1 isoform X1 [Nilaparvata lugens]|uniref:snurportin-1 isoform X1 n=1 Tax=Nilaparvata lugens TaxID=108931 RepID=UPI00193E67F6|nr:snurportin-1 isoform X1 [Nilaparvata lugens]